MENYPLSAYFAAGGRNPGFSRTSSNCWRGYFATWEVLDNRLYLRALTGWLGGATRVDLSAVFPNCSDGVLADWFTGQIKCPLGAGKQVLYGVFVHPSHLILSVESGVIQDAREVVNPNYAELPERDTGDEISFEPFGLTSESCDEGPRKSAHITATEFLEKFKIGCFYHFTDTRNLPSIKRLGGLLPWSQIKGSVVAPGGNGWSHDADAIKGQDNYVHLCFFPEHPMEFVARNDGRILESRFLRVDPSVIHTPGILFSPDVSNKSGVPMMDLTTAASEMDFGIIALADKWLDPSLFERKKRASKYELLVPGKIPLSLISGV